MTRQAGISISSISPIFSEEIIELLEKSEFKTFESVHRVFPKDKPELLTKFAEMLKRSGKTAPTYHCPYGDEYDLSSPNESIRIDAVEKIKYLFKEAKILCASILVVHASTDWVPDDERSERFGQTRKSLADFESLLKDYDMRMAVEFLPRKCIGNNADELLDILSDKSDSFGVCLDVNHLMSDYASLPSIVRKLDKRLYHLHISDYDGIDERHMIPGQGVIDWKTFLDALDEIGYCGAFNYELRLEGSPEERIKKVEDNYKNILLPLMKLSIN